MSSACTDNGGTWSAAVNFDGKSCVLTFSSLTSCVTMSQEPRGDTTRLLLNIPASLIINFESGDECHERQLMRKRTDFSIKEIFAKGNANNTLSLQKETDVSAIVNALPSSNSSMALSPASNSSSGSPEATSPSTYTDYSYQRRRVECQDEKAASGDAPSDHFFMHYVRMEPNGKLKSLHTLTFIATSAQERRNIQELSSRLLARVYEKGPKKILIFVSPVSGKGEGLSVVEKTLMPVLHFSRHRVQLIVTTRAHHCEDFLANVDNPINEHHVVVAVGGDGMVNEVINGIHRRKLLYIKHFREKQEELQRRGDGSETGDVKSERRKRPCLSIRDKFPTGEELQRGWDALLPLVATIPTGSACGLAKGLDELHPLAASLALIRCSSVHSDLLRFRFLPNSNLLSFHESRMSKNKMERLERKFSLYKERNKEELEELGTEESLVLSPFLRSGETVHRDPISLHIGAPTYTERVAFMSLSYGVPNDIDRGSEKLRWMGNARFMVYAGLCMLRGPGKYKGVVRYLPWELKNGKRVEKLSSDDDFAVQEEIPLCTNREDCPFCASEGSDRGNTFAKSSSFTLEGDASLLQEESVDFDDTSLPWKTIEGEFHLLMVCGIRDVARDAIMAPLAHLSDRAMDIVFCKADQRYGRKEFLNFFTALEKGKHLNQPFTGYVKARAADIQVDGGIVMADGEMLPLSRVQLTLLRQGVHFVRCDY